jgi:hypothetical protein
LRRFLSNTSFTISTRRDATLSRLRASCWRIWSRRANLS